ncbi:MAG: NAD(P)-dependent oxidoreductase, partial [Phycisphaerae bacterium]
GGLRGIDLRGRTFGALGTGSIARHALRIAGGFGMRRLGYDIKPDQEAAGEIGFEYVELDELLGESDILSLHVPYNKHTHHLLDAEAIAKMKDGAILINTARGGIVDPQALLEALRSGKLSGAGLDVLEAEQSVGEEAELLSRNFDQDKLVGLVRNHAMIQMENVIITPHMAFNSEEAVLRIVDTTVENIHAFASGEPANVVNKDVLEKVKG